MTSLQAAILDVSSIAQAHVRPRTDSVGATVGTVREALELIGLVQHVSAVASARVGPGAVPVQAGSIARGFALVLRGSHRVTRLAGTRFRCGAESVEAAIGTYRLASLITLLVPRSTLANTWSNAVSSSTSTLTLGHTKAILIRRVTIVTHARVHRHTSSNSAASLTAGKAEPATLVQLVTVLADALPQIQITNAVVTSDGARGDALALVVLDKVWIAAASVWTNAQPVEAGLLTHGITLAEVVHVPLEAFAANLDATQRGVGPVTGRNESVVWLYQADCGHLVEADPGWDRRFGLVHELI